MPLYEYECPACGELSTRERPPLDRNKRVHCDHCPGRKPKLIISSTSFSLAGGGWASTGYSVGKPPGKKVKKNV